MDHTLENLRRAIDGTDKHIGELTARGEASRQLVWDLYWQVPEARAFIDTYHSHVAQDIQKASEGQ